MNGVHDLGGMHGFGKVEPEPNEPPFHAPWEGRVLAMQRAMRFTRAWNIDMSRDAQERLPAGVYLSASYYQRWALGIERNALERGLIDADEIAAGRALRPGKPVKRMRKDDLGQAFTRGSFSRPTGTQARFEPGDRVRAKNINPPSHTRLPRYARGHVGVVEAVRGCHVFPDSVTTGGGEHPEWLYTVVFNGRELWGENADPTLKVSIEAFEPYLDPLT
jgi:nitrile hydratase beta subunit